MIVTCPGCTTRYLVDPRALGAAGRLVRCANCANTWHQTPPEDAPRRVEMSSLDLDEEPIVRRSEERIQHPALPPRRNSVWTGAAWVVVLVILAGLGIGAVWARERIVQAVPATAALYQMIGFSVLDAADGFDLPKPELVRATDERGLPVFKVSGEVINRSKLTREPPTLRLTLRDSADQDLYHWTATIDEERLLPGQTGHYHTSVSEPNKAAASVEIVIVSGRN